ncbi:MAG: hypothetical protein JOY71_25620 [Acetobacteraceae bacterium]|nr:hypothetical protein [Acetobacteraceae bacterium]
MPLDGTEFALLEGHPLAKLSAVERLLATRQQWCQGKMRDEEGRHCLVGAMEAAQARQTLEPIILRAAREVGGKRYWRIEFFNDDPRTSHADVLRVLRRARENIIHNMIDGDRRRSWRQMLGEAWRAVRAGSITEACVALMRQRNEPLDPIAVMPVSVSIDQETREPESVRKSRTLCGVS